MKLLLDENLSPRLVESLADLYPGSDHVHNLNLGGADDAEVWNHAKAHRYGLAIIPLLMWRRYCVRRMRRFAGLSRKMKRLVCYWGEFSCGNFPL